MPQVILFVNPRKFHATLRFLRVKHHVTIWVACTWNLDSTHTSAGDSLRSAIIIFLKHEN